MLSKTFAGALIASAMAVANVAALPQGPESSVTSTVESSSAAPTSAATSSAPLSSSPSGGENTSSTVPISTSAGPAGPIPTGLSKPGSASINVTAVTTTGENQTGFECWSVSEGINTTSTGGGVAVLYDFAPQGNVTLSLYTPGADLGTVNASTTYWALVSSGLAEFTVTSTSNSTNATEPDNSSAINSTAEDNTQWAPVTPGLYGLVLVDGNDSAPVSYNLSFPGASLTTLLAAAIDKAPEHKFLYSGPCNVTSTISGLLQ